MCSGVSDPHLTLECLHEKAAANIDEFSAQCLTIVERYTKCVDQDETKPKPGPPKPSPLLTSKSIPAEHRRLQGKPKPKPSPGERPCWAGGIDGGGSDGEGGGFSPVESDSGELADAESKSLLAPAPRAGA